MKTNKLAAQRILTEIRLNNETMESIGNTWYDDEEERSEMENTIENIRCENDLLMQEYHELTGEYEKPLKLI